MPVPYTQMILAIQKEGNELSNRVAAVNQFVGTEGFSELDILDRHMITLQREVMQTYLHILTMRMARYDEARKGVLSAGASALGKKIIIQ